MKYSRIAEQLRDDIAQGKLSPGQRMPSIRELCLRFQCTKVTAVRAYQELKEMGLVYSVPGSGYYLIHDAARHGGEGGAFDFSGFSLDADSLPYGQFEPCVSEAMLKYKQSLFSYSDPQGLEPLIDALGKHLQEHQLFPSRERIFVTTGSQQALHVLARMPFPNGKPHAAVEQPCYHGMLESLRLGGITPIGVERGFEGLDFERLETVFRSDQVKFFYTVPRFSNPLGLSYTNEEKKRIAALARKHDVYIIEDDYLGDLESDAKSTPIYSFDTSDRVVYIKTFSKVLLPGLRVAVVVLPEKLVASFREYKYWTDLNSPLLSQGALEVFLSSGLFRQHMRGVRSMYAERLEQLRRLTALESPSIRWHIPSQNGFYAGLELTGGSGARAAQDALKRKNILVSDMDHYYLQPFYRDSLLRVSVANIAGEEMQQGFQALVQEIQEMPTRKESWLRL